MEDTNSEELLRLNLVDVLSVQGSHVLNQLQNQVESGALNQLQQLTTPQERAVWLVNHFDNAGRLAFGRFLEAVCMCCEDMPMFLESQLMSASESLTGTAE